MNLFLKDDDLPEDDDIVASSLARSWKTIESYNAEFCVP